ncbi:CASP8 protein, partial [Leiothrix lutea]|nr:CASP8 protein [Leiothrix lutea]
LLAVSDELDEAELAALKFLSRDHVPWRKLEAVRSPHDLFEALQEKGVLEAGNLAFLRELLYCIGRIDLLVSHLGSSREQVERELRAPGGARLPPFRYLLFRLYEDVTEYELSSFKLHLAKDLPNSKLTRETLLQQCHSQLCQECQALRPSHPSTTVDSGHSVALIKKKLMSTVTYLAQQTFFLLLLSKSLSNAESDPQWILFFCFLFKCRKYRSKQLILLKAKSNEFKFTSSLEGDPVLLCCPSLQNVFSKLHFRVEEYRDLTAEGIRETVKSFQSKDHEDKDCFVCCILSHGKKGIIYGVDGQEVPIRELTTAFTAQNCNSLAGKPKVFFIQACQGDAFHKGVTIETDSGEQDSSVERDARFQLDCIPAEPDFLLGMATLQDYVSYRSTREGTWYIQALCQHLEYSCPRGEDVLTILTAVNQEVSKKTCERGAKKQMPQPSFTLRKRLIFPVN